jgi:ABC-type branched-subunit amino acid transport system ATPase component
MDPVFIDRVEAKNYGCLYDVKLDLTPLHALVGPNDSGKSTILRAVRVLTEVLRRSVKTGQGEAVRNSGFEPDREPRLFAEFGTLSIALTGKAAAHSQLQFILGSHDMNILGTGDLFGLEVRLLNNATFAQDLQRVGRIFGGPTVLRLDPDELRKDSALIPKHEPVTFGGDRGHRLAGIYDAINNRGDGSFGKISDQVRRLFPTIKNIRLDNVTDKTKALEIELTDGTKVPAEFMSEGLLYYLAFAAVQYLERPAVVLVEEPENGLHPARIAEVMKILREISKTTQVIIATHSPLVVNELSPDEVSVVTRTKEKGTSVRRLSSAANFADRSKVYALGELWLSYANGVDESALFAAQRSP